MTESSYKQANNATRIALSMGYNVFSPITHSHPLTEDPDIEIPHDWSFWRNIDIQFLDWADEMWILVPEEGIEKVLDSVGVTEESIYATDRGIPVRYFYAVGKQLIETHLDEFFIQEGFTD